MSKRGGKQFPALSSNQYNSLSHAQKTSEANSLRPRTELAHASFSSQKGSLGAQPRRRGGRRRLVALGSAAVVKHDSIQAAGLHEVSKFESTQEIGGEYARSELRAAKQIQLQRINDDS